MVPDVRRNICPGGPSAAEGGRVNAQELAERLELVPRLQAIADELRLLDDADVPATLTEGLLEELEQVLADEGET
jgi:hypothetical protein